MLSEQWRTYLDQHYQRDFRRLCEAAGGKDAASLDPKAIEDLVKEVKSADRNRFIVELFLELALLEAVVEADPDHHATYRKNLPFNLKMKRGSPLVVLALLDASTPDAMKVLTSGCQELLAEWAGAYDDLTRPGCGLRVLNQLKSAIQKAADGADAVLVKASTTAITDAIRSVRRR